MLMAIRVFGRINFRYRLLLAIFTGKQILFDFSEETTVGSKLLKPNEISLLRLLDRITSGTQLQVDQEQRLVRVQPGVLLGGNFTHQCSTCRGITYYLEFLALLAPFCKRPLEATLTGVTAHSLDITVDTFQNVTIPMLRKLGLGKECSLKIKKRESSDDQLGEVVFSCPIMTKALEPIEWKNRQEIKRIRGVAYCSRIPPNIANQLIDHSRSILCEYLADVYIYSDWNPGKGNVPTLSLSLFGETSNGFLLGADCSWKGQDWSEEILSKVSQEATKAFLFQAMENSVVDTNHQLFICLWMALSSADLSSVELGRLTPCTVQLLRDIHDFMGVAFQIEQNDKSNQPGLVCSCIGMEYRNENRRRY